MTLVKSILPVGQWDEIPDCGEGVEVLGVRLLLPHSSLLIVNLYRPAASVLELGEIFSAGASTHMLLGGDFNAHHPVLGSTAAANAAGNTIAATMEEYGGLLLLNDDTPTHIRGGVLDLTFVSPSIHSGAAWAVSDEVVSDHFGTTTTLTLSPTAPPPDTTPHWNISKADWDKFRREMELWATTYEATDIDSHAKDLAAALVQAADHAIPRRKTGPHYHRHAWYYSPEVAKLKNQLNQAKKAFRKQRTPQALTVLREVTRGVADQLREIRAETWLRWCQTMSASSSAADIWRWLRRAAGKRRDRPPPVICPKTEANRIANEFATRAAPDTLPLLIRRALEAEREERAEEIQRACTTPSELDTPFTTEEIGASYKTSSNTAPGGDGVLYALIAHMGPAAEDKLLELCNSSLLEGRAPSPWKTQTTVPIPKRGEMANPRPIALLSCVAKTMERMLLPRLEYTTGDLSPYIYAFRRGVGTQDCLTDLLSHIGRGPALAAFVDLDKAYERVDPLVLLSVLTRHGISGKTLQWLQSYITGRTTTVRLQGTLSDMCQLESGTPQGSILSPFLFTVLMDELLRVRCPETVRLFCYADDLAVVAVGPDRARDITTVLTALTTQSRRLGLLASPQKSRAIAFRGPRPPTPLRLGGTNIPWADSHKYLGMVVDSWLTFDKELNYLNPLTAHRHF